MGGHDVHRVRERDHAKQVLAHQTGIRVGEHAHHEGPLGAEADRIELPGQIADEGVPLAGRQSDENDYGAIGVAAAGGDDYRSVPIDIESRGKAEVGCGLELISMQLVISGDLAENSSSFTFGRISQFVVVDPDRELEIIETAHVVPVGMCHQHPAEPAVVVATDLQLLANGAGQPVRSALQAGESLYVRRNPGAEARIDQ
ncbi:hypothetical protein JHN46_28435 [Streptomyces sp. MBT33]|nr:hypothetical protein [Streptomyces sp. MBT33]MBK3644580.1 hypothetical protein [Streptomyces sp. MBT33]